MILVSDKVFTKEEMQEIVKNISLDYKGTDLNIKIISRKDFLVKNKKNFVNDENSKNVFLKLKSYMYMYFIKGVCYCDDDHIDIVYDKNKNIFLDKKEQIFDLIFCCYHEIRHKEQSAFSPYSYSGFLRDLEYFLNKADISNYRKNSCMFSYEIGANLYAIDKTSRYLYKYYQDIYTAKSKKLEEIYAATISNYILYNAEIIINDAIILYKYMVSENGLKTIDSNFISPVFKLFFDDNGDLKEIREIINDPSFSKLDRRIFYEIISSDYVVNEIIRNKILTREEKNVFDKALEYKRCIAMNQRNFYMKYKNSGIKKK